MLRAPRLALTVLLVGLATPVPAQTFRSIAGAPVHRAPRVNAPVAPEAVYIGYGTVSRGVSVIDLNGLGQGTGDIKNTRFPLNPNIGKPGVVPALRPGSRGLDAGSAGALTLTMDEHGGRRFQRARIHHVTDMHLGQPLDLVYNNENVNVDATSKNQVNPATNTVMPGNTVSVAPHPNPPRIIVPSPNPTRFIDCEEPTVTTSINVPNRVTTRSPPCLPSPINVLTKGDPFHPRFPGLFDARFQVVFYGPQPRPADPRPPRPFCPFTSRQQVGHFLYVLDRARSQVLVLNSNRFNVVGGFLLQGPTSMAMHPNLKVLAVSSDITGSVFFIDTDPGSPRFHRVIGNVRVGRQPSGLAWQPEGEDLLVCNRGDSSLSIIDGATFTVRKTLTAHLKSPVDVAVTVRHFQVGWNTWTYFAFVLNGDGSLAVYESGPAPIGVDAMRATGLTFRGARAIQPDLPAQAGGCWITHRDATGLGQVSNVHVNIDRSGKRSFPVMGRYGGSNATTRFKDKFSGNEIVDIAFDEIRNEGAFPDYRSVYRPGLTYAPHSGKGQLKQSGRRLVPATVPIFMFVALGDTGKVDVIVLNTGKRLRTLDTPGVTTLSHYWRQ